jgi:hypothetical protein
VLPIEADTRRKSLETHAQDQIPIACLLRRPPAAPKAHSLTTRFRALALFERRSAERVARSVLPASENLHITGREQGQQKSLFNYLIRDGEQFSRHGQAERSGSCEIEHQFKFRRGLHRKICRFGLADKAARSMRKTREGGAPATRMRAILNTSKQPFGT